MAESVAQRREWARRMVNHSKALEAIKKRAPASDLTELPWSHSKNARTLAAARQKARHLRSDLDAKALRERNKKVVVALVETAKRSARRQDELRNELSSQTRSGIYSHRSTSACDGGLSTLTHFGRMEWERENERMAAMILQDVQPTPGFSAKDCQQHVATHANYKKLWRPRVCAPNPQNVLKATERLRRRPVHRYMMQERQGLGTPEAKSRMGPGPSETPTTRPSTETRGSPPDRSDIADRAATAHSGGRPARRPAAPGMGPPDSRATHNPGGRAATADGSSRHTAEVPLHRPQSRPSTRGDGSGSRARSREEKELGRGSGAVDLPGIVEEGSQGLAPRYAEDIFPDRFRGELPDDRGEEEPGAGIFSSDEESDGDSM
mmetsp:Transcript_31880/g.82599  ORF Transcript_31880/g.82599 Transcript_31880/m.82599 type:complete len:379 (-) Transcript_31880:231-1367(-)